MTLNSVLIQQQRQKRIREEEAAVRAAQGRLADPNALKRLRVAIPASSAQTEEHPHLSQIGLPAPEVNPVPPVVDEAEEQVTAALVCSPVASDPAPSFPSATSSSSATSASFSSSSSSSSSASSAGRFPLGGPHASSSSSSSPSSSSSSFSLSALPNACSPFPSPDFCSMTRLDCDTASVILPFLNRKSVCALMRTNRFWADTVRSFDKMASNIITSLTLDLNRLQSLSCHHLDSLVHFTLSRCHMMQVYQAQTMRMCANWLLNNLGVWKLEQKSNTLWKRLASCRRNSQLIVLVRHCVYYASIPNPPYQCIRIDSLLSALMNCKPEQLEALQALVSSICLSVRPTRAALQTLLKPMLHPLTNLNRLSLDFLDRLSRVAQPLRFFINQAVEERLLTFLEVIASLPVPADSNRLSNNLVRQLELAPAMIRVTSCLRYFPALVPRLIRVATKLEGIAEQICERTFAAALPPSIVALAESLRRELITSLCRDIDCSKTLLRSFLSPAASSSTTTSASSSSSEAPAPVPNPAPAPAILHVVHQQLAPPLPLPFPVGQAPQAPAYFISEELSQPIHLASLLTADQASSLLYAIDQRVREASIASSDEALS